METLWINGKYMPLEQGTVPIEDRSLLFGDGIYEVIASYDGVPILLQEHLDRWDRSAEGLRIPQIYSREQRLEVFHELLARIGTPNAMLYGQLSRGTGRRAHQFPKEAKPIEFWYSRALPDYPKHLHADGVGVFTHPDERWARCWIKSTSLLANCLAKQYAHERGGFEALLVNDQNIVTEGAVANFSCIKNGTIYTHPEDGRILGGCKRNMVLRLARKNGIEVREEKYTLDFLKTAEEAFLSSTTINVLPVTKLDGAPVGTGKVGPVTAKLMALVADEIRTTREAALAAAK